MADEVKCKQCGNLVEESRRSGWATPVCYGCVPVTHMETKAALATARAERDAERAELVRVRYEITAACETLGMFAGDSVQVGEDGAECIRCGYVLDNDGNGHSRCPVPVITDALGTLDRALRAPVGAPLAGKPEGGTP